MTSLGSLGRKVAVCALLVATSCGAPPGPNDDAGGGVDSAVMACATNAECDDGMFCTGTEACMPSAAGADARGCVRTPTCMPSQQCNEAEDRCVTSCAVAPDADGDGASAIACGGTDCDDADAMRFPGNPEICDVANRDEDCDPSTFGARDADGDTFVDVACCNVGASGAMRCGDDCNDTRRDAHPGIPEVCEGIDNDCDGSVDEGLTLMEYPDRDFDLHGDEDVTTMTAVCPGTPGYSTLHDDCDDASPVVHRAQLEICDRIDNNCNGMVDEAPVSVAWYPDEDGDLFGAPSDMVVISCEPVAGYSTRSSDCNDADAMIHPGAHERCNGVDDDCNGFADAGGLRPGDTEDDDGDLVPDVACGGSDCDDADVGVNPGAQELCNGIDDDCDTVVDGASADANWYLDLDHDGYGDSFDASHPAIMSCTPQAGRVPRGGDCDDGNAMIHPRVPDFCDDVDADCDSNIDENGIRFAYFPDADMDGWGSTSIASIVFRCTQPAGTVAQTGDCEDTRATRYPGAHEDCQGLDDDCDASIDEDSDQMWYPDGDRDGHGAGTAIVACMAPVGHALLGDDCDDANASNFPGNTELCNGRDDDCDGVSDDGAAAQCDGYAHTAATTACTAGACVLACDSGFGDCNGTTTDGCEVDLRRSAAYCGTCTNTCHPADTCGLTTPGTCDASRVVALAEAYTSNFAVRATGGVAAWGDSTSSITTSGTDAPIPFGTSLASIVQVDGSREGHACALTSGRRVLCWGLGTSGQLGDGSAATRAAPREITALPDAIQISVGGVHSCAVLTTGSVMCWGANSANQLGDGTASQRNAPVLVTGITDAVEVYAGYRHTCARRGSAGSYYVSCWGNNMFGELGIGAVGAARAAPQTLTGLPTNLAMFAHGASAQATYVITSDGLAYGWGSNSFGDLGLGVGAANPVASPTLNTSLTGVVEMSLDATRGCARTTTGTAGAYDIWCWGFQGAAASANPPWIDGTTTGNAYTPLRAGPPGARITDSIAIIAGADAWCAARASGGVVCMGADTNGQLGDGATLATQLTPVPVVGLP